MKKIIFLILFISPFTTAFGEWIKFYEDELRIGYYENSKDFECFASNCEGRSFWVLTDFKKKNQDIQSKVEKVSFYCWQRKIYGFLSGKLL